jgi:hypothetical protein
MPAETRAGVAFVSHEIMQLPSGLSVPLQWMLNCAMKLRPYNKPIASNANAPRCTVRRWQPSTSASRLVTISLIRGMHAIPVEQGYHSISAHYLIITSSPSQPPDLAVTPPPLASASPAASPSASPSSTAPQLRPSIPPASSYSPTYPPPSPRDQSGTSRNST